MPAIHRYNDPNEANGLIRIIPQDFVFESGKLISVDGSKGTGHDDFEGLHNELQWETANGSDLLFIGGIAVNREGDADTCDHLRANGSEFVFSE